MRRPFYVVACVVAVVAMLAPPVLAQAPAPKVTITGLVDNLYNWNRNQNMGRGGGGFDITDSGDNEAYGRTRGRFDFIGEVGKGKAVLGFEFDLLYGAQGRSATGSGVDNPASRLDGTSGGFDADNDVRNALELKWMYVEFPFAGPGSLMPFLPVAGMARVGGQPYTITYKPHVFAASDFGGLHVDLAFAPDVKGSVTFAQAEEKSTDSSVFPDEDLGVILAVEITPFKGLDIKPIYAWQEIGGIGSGNLRRPTGGIANDAANFGGGAGGFQPTTETRHWLGVDARWRSGPWSLGPTFFYQFGEREVNTASVGTQTADRSAWILDVEGGYRIGPLFLEARGVITSGNEAKHNLRTHDIEYYEPFQIGNGYWIGWGEAVGIGNIDYLTALNRFGTSVSLASAPSYDRYGRVMFAARARYSFTPALSVYGIVTPMWTYEEVDTDGTISAGSGLTPSAAADGDSRYLGTGLTAGLTYRFAPNLTFDTVYGVLFPGSAMDIARTPGGPVEDAKNSYVATARVRFAF